MSEKMVYDDVYTSLHIDEYSIEARDTKLGKEEFTIEIPNSSEDMVSHLDSNGIVIPGTEVKEGDILVGKITPRSQTDPTPQEKLLYAIFLDRVSLSITNGWVDENGRVFIYYSVIKICEILNCGTQKACKLLDELETFGALERRRQGLGKPNRLYLKKVF